MEESVICSLQLSTLVVQVVLGISAILIVLHLIQVLRCFVSIMRIKISGLEIIKQMWMMIMIIILKIICGLATLTCYHMEEGKVPSSMVGSQDALLPIPTGMQINQTMSVTMKIGQQCILMTHGMTV
jgi:hypothetical protein